MKKWTLYTLSLGFGAYWASNLILWFPWSYSTELGITLMLTVAPILWAYITYLALKTYPKPTLYKGAMLVALILLPLAVILDYIFFGLIRKAMEELYHPTTLYGYAFLLVFPFLIAWIFKNRIMRYQRQVINSDIAKAAISGFVCLVVLTLIIVFRVDV